MGRQPGRIVTPGPVLQDIAPRRSPPTCAACGLHSAHARVVRDYLE
jgi:hypothetical protein